MPRLNVSLTTLTFFSVSNKTTFGGLKAQTIMYFEATFGRPDVYFSLQKKNPDKM